MIDNNEVFVLDMKNPDAPPVTLQAILDADRFTDPVTTQDTIQMLDDTIIALNGQVSDLTEELAAMSARVEQAVVKSSLTTATTTTTTTTTTE